MDFRGFDSSINLILRGGILMSIGDFLEDFSQAILLGIMLAGRLDVTDGSPGNSDLYESAFEMFSTSSQKHTEIITTTTT